jgi:hypothetical protein
MRANGYTCNVCEQVTMTYHVDEGTTPMFLRCRATEGCDGQATSMMYPFDNGWIPPELAALPRWEWYAPTEQQARQAGHIEVRDHVQRGGLLLRGPVTQ